jgi:hypothetical protein
MAACATKHRPKYPPPAPHTARQTPPPATIDPPAQGSRLRSGPRSHRLARSRCRRPTSTPPATDPTTAQRPPRLRETAPMPWRYDVSVSRAWPHVWPHPINAGRVQPVRFSLRLGACLPRRGLCPVRRITRPLRRCPPLDMPPIYFHLLPLL